MGKKVSTMKFADVNQTRLLLNDVMFYFSQWNKELQKGHILISIKDRPILELNYKDYVSLENDMNQLDDLYLPKRNFSRSFKP